jgi:hypothetical protein
LLFRLVIHMFDRGLPPGEARTPKPSVWVQYADNLLPVAAIFGAIGLVLLSLSLLWNRLVPPGTRGFALIELTVATVAALAGLWWRRRRRRRT